MVLNLNPRGMSEPPLHNPHDKFFKETLGRTTTAAEFFGEYLPSEVASRLDWFPKGKFCGNVLNKT